MQQMSAADHASEINGVTQKAAREYCWRVGIIAAWFLRGYQLDIYDLLCRERFPVVEASRQIGKTTTDLVFVAENLRRNENFIWRWCEPWKYQAREIVIPAVEALFLSCPKSLRPKFYKTDSFYEIPDTLARLYLRGVNEDRGESSRGSFAHGITADETGSWKDPEYILNEVLLPQLTSTNGCLHKLGTPPRDLDHYWYRETERAMAQNRLVRKDINDCDAITEEQKNSLCEAVGGKDSPSWQREYLLNPVADPDALVIPEYSEDLVMIEDDFPQPELFDVYVGGDSGVDDNTAIHFGYYHFEKDLDVVEDELVVRGKTSADIIDQAKEIEKRLFGDKKPFIRVYDGSKQLLMDITSTLKWSVVLPKKDDKHAAIHQWRRRVQEGRFKVKRRCKHLHRQMKVGMWRDEKKQDFTRSDELGHLDALASALYFQRAIVRSRNPYPPLYGFNPEHQHISPLERAPDKSEAKAFAGSFRPFTRRGA